MKTARQMCQKDSKEQDIWLLLEREEIGDHQPSIFLSRLQNLADDTVSDDFLKTFWMGRLPPSVQTILVTQNKDSLDDLASLADAVIEASSQPHVATVATPRHEVVFQLAKLRREIAVLRLGTNNTRQVRPRSRSQPRDGSRSFSRSRSNSKEKPLDDGRCWYH